MTDYFPLIFDTVENKLKELPSGDSLDLQNSTIANAVAVQASTISAGSIDVGSITIDGENLADVAFTGSYYDIPDRPAVFDKNYNSLFNKPFIPQIIGDLNNVEAGVPDDGTFLSWNTSENRWAFTDIIPIDLENYKLDDLNDVVAINVAENAFLKYFSGAWRESSVTWNDVKNKPTNVSYFANDAGYLTSGFTVDKIDRHVSRSFFANDKTFTSGSAIFPVFDSSQGDEAFGPVTGKFTAPASGLYRFDVVFGLTSQVTGVPITIFVYDSAGVENIVLFDATFTGTVLTASGITFLTEGNNYNIGLIQSSGSDLTISSDKTGIGIEQLT